QHRVDLRSATGGSFVRIAHAFQSGEHGDLVHQNASRLAHSFFGRDNTVGFDVENQFVQVGTLLNTSAFDGIADTTHWAERSVEHDAADGLRTIVGQGANVAGHVATTLLYLDMHFQLAGLGEVGNDVIRIDDLDVVGQFDV